MTDDLLASFPFLERMVPGLPVWQLRQRGLGLRNPAMEAEKIAVLERLGVTSGNAFLAYSEDPVLDGVPGRWTHAGEGTWRVPADVDLAAMLNWLHLGGWMLYSATEPVPTAELYPIGFAPTAGTLAQTRTRLDLGFIIVSFHDDDFWTIALRA